ncbi:armadillo repeat-containing protein 6 isoform X2 [Asparagus officinalis]|uniref:armadillo repeat-containing protein 6 isoform X2 n=1 Tax=Asparagus officinalis TaxID=4686 RepID=UPI00098E7829|nr:armadillo repeat-containing protein 6 isoform X2 [Asparagus officinalis]
MSSKSRAISQQAFESLVTENIEDLGMDPDEALEDAVQTLTLQGVDLSDVQSTETFRQSDGPKIVMDILNNHHQNIDILDGGLSVIAAAATCNEVLKEQFVDLKVDELFLQIMGEHSKDTPQSLYDAIRVLLTPDDNRVVASQVFGYARRFAKLGIANALIGALQGGQRSSSSLISACIALKAVAVNDEICRSISENGGIDAIFQFIDGSGEYNNKAVARACCSLLSKLAGSDDNKTAIVQKGGLDRLIKLSSRFSDDPSVLQEVMSTIGILSLRSPENAARAVEAGAGDLAIQSMQKLPAAYQMQRQSCLMIRNLVARNPENRTILLNNGIEKLIRKAKGSHQSCKDAATAALRDLGLDDYNA